MNGRWPGAIWLLGCLLFVASPRCEAQNLVPNPSFELLDTCPYTIGFQEGDRPLYWMSWSQSPEYFHGCSTDSLVGVPQNGWGFQNAWDGNAYVGMLAYSMGDNFREYVGVELLEPLAIGQAYSVKMRVNLAMGGSTWPSKVAADRMGLLFTMNSNEWTTIPGPSFGFRNYAHVVADQILADTAQWSLIAGTFTADSAYNYLVVGNFFEDDLTDTINVDYGPTAGAYYFVDSVSVTPVSNGNGVSENDPLRGIWYDGDSDALHVEWPVNHHAEIHIVDPTGRIIFSVQTVSGHFTWTPSELGYGVYVVVLREKQGRSMLKFVHQ